MTPPPLHVSIIGAPCDLGANIRGAALGPACLRNAGIQTELESLGIRVTDQGNVAVPQLQDVPAQDQAQKFRDTILEVNQRIYNQCQQALSANRQPLLLGGDHSNAIGSIAAIADCCAAQGKKLGCIWFDAHADLNTPESSPSGNIHGMPLAILLGHGDAQYTSLGQRKPKLQPECTTLIGLRSVDAAEKQMCRSSGIRAFTMRDVDEQGMGKLIQQTLKDFAQQQVDWIHVSFDLDALDPLHAPGVSTTEPGGISLRESHLALEMLAETQQGYSFDLVELNPTRDLHQSTAKLGIQLVCSFFGKSIL
ncbi:MAG: arginase [Zetaproteobacteria bacterium]|nr:arginase [Zetaproteobacteria bacterium]